MKGLLLKDYYILKRQMKFLVVMLALFALVPFSYFQLFAVVYAALVPYTIVAYDEQSHWDELAGMMPYSVRDLVLSKYVLGWCMAGFATLLTLVSRLVLGRFSDQALPPEALLAALSVALLTIAISLPFLFRFGVAKGRIIMMFIIVMTCGSAGLLSGLFKEGGPVRVPAGLYLLPLIALAATAVSVPASMAMYRKKYN